MSKKLEVEPIGCACGDHFFAVLSRGYVTMVSPIDADQLRHKWNATVSERPSNVRVKRSITTGPYRQRKLALAREIMECPDHLVVDHKNGNPLDNRRNNLRLATPAENAQNRRVVPGRPLSLKGIHETGGRFRVLIGVNYRRLYLGTFDTVEDARAAYREAAVLHFGEFARFE